MGGDIGGSDMIIMHKSPPLHEMVVTVGSTQSQQLMVEEVKVEEEVRVNPHQLHQ